MRACVRACERACVRACVRARVRACVRACASAQANVHVRGSTYVLLCTQKKKKKFRSLAINDAKLSRPHILFETFPM